jgi:hypothetical protein
MSRSLPAPLLVERRAREELTKVCGGPGGGCEGQARDVVP